MRTRYQALTIVAALLLTAAPFAFAQREGRRDPERPKDNEVVGVIKAIDIKIGTLTLASGRERALTDTVFNLADKNIKVTTSLGQYAKLSDLAAGMTVYAELKGEKDVVALKAMHPTLAIVLAEVDPAKKTIAMRNERVGAQSFAVADDARIMVNGKAGKLADLAAGARAVLTLSLDKKTVLALDAGQRIGDRPRIGDAPRVRDGERGPAGGRIAKNQGTIVDFDASKGSINILFGREGDSRLQTLTLAKDMKIKVLYGERTLQEVTVAQLSKPLTATVQMADDKKTVRGFSVQAPIVYGSVKAVDPAGKKITVVEGRDEARTFAVDDAVRLMIRDGGEGTLADVPAGMAVALGLSLDRQRVIVIAPAPRKRGR